MQDLALLNSWWREKGEIENDKHIKKFNESMFKWKPKIMDEIKLETGNVFTLRGPRQVGKTTLVKLLIKKLLLTHNEKSIFYYSCDAVTDFKELISVVRQYIEFAGTYNIKSSFLFLDEVSSVKNWQRGVKALIDSGELSNSCVFITGSHTLDIKYGFERLPGRTGEKGKSFMLLPMNFSEFIRLVKPNLKIKRAENLDDLLKNAKKNIVFSNELKILFNQYLITGGFPIAINEYFSKNDVPDYIYEIYEKWVVGDIVKWGKQEKLLKQIMKSVILRQGSMVSWDSLAKDSEVKSHKTTMSYLEDLENMFVVFNTYYLNLDSLMPEVDKNKKVYFFDPMIFHTFNKIIYFKKQEIIPSLIEAVVGSNFMRFMNEKYGVKLNECIYYFKKKKEVDFVLKAKQKMFAVEVKYQNKISKEDYFVFKNFKFGVLATKDTFETKKRINAIPVHVLLASL